jgi:hypothetical protein
MVFLLDCQTINILKAVTTKNQNMYAHPLETAEENMEKTRILMSIIKGE